MRRWAAPNGWFLVGEPYWAEPPSARTKGVFEADQSFVDLAGTLDRFESVGLDLVEMVLSGPEDWDRYRASQWLNVSDWLATNCDDPDTSDVHEQRDESRRSYLADGRRCFGWGVFVLRARR